MKIEYKLLDNGTGVILTRHPEVAESVSCTFLGAPSDATVILTTESGDTFYRKCAEEWSIPASSLKGVIKVTVAVLDGRSNPPKWICEEFVSSKLPGGYTFIAPNDMNLPQKFVELRLECQSLRESNERLETRVKELEDRLEKLLEGYDLT